ncbi:MAG: hypothetical protein IPK88_09620 [Saprospiraceae bacterium]|nr:hypothetical protein [Candidatus Defluviibacterium haderslevense]
MLKPFLALCKNLVGNFLVVFASICSILGIVLYFFTNLYSSILALLVFIFFLLALFIKIFYSIEKYFINKSNVGYRNLATFSKYSTKDGNIVTYEVHKSIVCKKMLIDNHEHRFQWTGSSKPIVSSDNMIVGELLKTEDGAFDKAILEFKKPLMYNDVSIIHVKLQMDDSDHRSKHCVTHKIVAPIQLINFKVELFHLDVTQLIKQAKLSRKKFNTQVDSEFVFIKSIPFDNLSHSYEHYEYDPTVGYIYKFEWE